MSIVVAAYNHESYITQCLQSILDCKAVRDLEIIVIDDGSTDHSLTVAKKCLAYSGSNFRIFTKPNEGLTSSLKLGLSLASAEFVAFMASDDAYIPSSLDSVIGLLGARNDADCAILFQAEYFCELSGPVYGKRISELFRSAPGDFVRTISVEAPGPMLLQSTVFGTRFLGIIDPWRDRLSLDDWPTFLQVSQKVASGIGSFEFDPSITLCKYRVHHLGIHKNLQRQLESCLEVANIVVEPKFRAESRANIFVDRSLNFLARGDVPRFVVLLRNGVREQSLLKALRRVLFRVSRKLFKR